MAKEKKKQHYVPRCYLEAWKTKDKYQTYVYNKKLKKAYLSNLHDVASERYFYDLEWSDNISPEVCKRLGITEETIHELNEKQIIENFFAERIEDEFKRILNHTINRANGMNHWEILNCWFISDDDKNRLSFHLALQLLRVASVRSTIERMNSIFSQLLNELDAPQEIIDKYTLPKKELSVVHANLMLSGNIELIVNAFYSKKWLLFINRTKKPFLTSDNPIRTIPTKQHPFRSMSGLNSDGVVIVFPISPNLLLFMIDDKHSGFSVKDRRIIEINNIEYVNCYNYYFITGESSFIFSNKNDFSLIDEVLENNPNLFELPNIVAKWGDRIITPEV